MTLHQQFGDAASDHHGPAGQRFTRQGRLAPYPGSPAAEQVRCQCDRCGSHLLAAVRPGGHLDGACPVCLSRAVTPLAVPHAAR